MCYCPLWCLSVVVLLSVVACLVLSLSPCSFSIRTPFCPLPHTSVHVMSLLLHHMPPPLQSLVPSNSRRYRPSSRPPPP
ncbi:hypothetical protein EJ02DRAFT_63606 [Clathrospora elynae]|uniref:Secreted peptide n=1 Tax=Clathrospora elynae TaxID=706981 RepID=A0A6A5SF77_9PLEO|nr:hypothetical protein EJ02DRAFT_63606 [Clathrospora elynae]